MAFDLGFDEPAFFDTHVFRQEADALFGDLVGKSEMSTLLDAALRQFDAAVQAMPASWQWLDGVEQTLPAQINLQAVKSRLAARAGLHRGSP